MKKNLFLLFLIFALFICSCSEPMRDSGSDSEAEKEYTPIFVMKMLNDRKSDTLFYPASNGFIYIAETENGCSASYLDLASSKGIEEIFTSEAVDITEIKIFPSDASAFAIAGNELYISSLEKKACDKRTLPEYLPEEALLYDSVSFIYCDDASGLILLEPIDFSEKYVLGKKSVLLGKEYPICSKNKNIYFTEKSADGYSSIVRLWYGDEKADIIFGDDFESYKLLADSDLLIKISDSEYAHLDSAASRIARFSVDKKYISYASDSEFKYFGGLYNENGNNIIEVRRVSDSGFIKRLDLGAKKISSDIEISPDGKYLIFSVIADSDGTETVSYIKISE